MSAGAPPARERPRRLDAIETVFQTTLLSLRRSSRGARFLVALVLVALPLVVSWLVAKGVRPEGQERFFYGMLGFYHFGIAVPGVALAFATAFPWPEAEEGTLTYWFTAPVRRWTIHLGRFLAALAIGAAVLPLSVAAIALPLATPETSAVGEVAVAAIATTLLAYPVYLALFWLNATVFRKGLAFGMVFVLVETFLSMVPANVVRLTVVYYVRSAVRPAIPSGSLRRARAFLQQVDAVPAGEARLTLVLVACVALVLSLLLVEWIEYRGKTSQAT